MSTQLLGVMVAYPHTPLLTHGSKEGFFTAEHIGRWRATVPVCCYQTRGHHPWLLCVPLLTNQTLCQTPPFGYSHQQSWPEVRTQSQWVSSFHVRLSLGLKKKERKGNQPTCYNVCSFCKQVYKLTSISGGGVQQGEKAAKPVTTVWDLISTPVNVKPLVIRWANISSCVCGNQSEDCKKKQIFSHNANQTINTAFHSTKTWVVKNVYWTRNDFHNI